VDKSKLMDSPIFVLGNPRSGTSLLRTIINSHDNFVLPPECGFLHWLYPKYQYFSGSEPEKFIDDLFSAKKFEGWKLEKQEITDFIISNYPKSYSELCAGIYYFYGLKQGKDVQGWGDKNNYYIHHLEDIANIYPRAKFIHIVRNPKDVISSYLQVNQLPDSKYKPDLPQNIMEIAKQWLDNNNHVANFLARNDCQYIQLQLEHLLTDTDSTIDQIFHFIGLSSSDVLKNFSAKKFHDEPEITMGWKNKLLGPIVSNNFRTYEGILTAGQIADVDAYVHGQKKHFDFVDL
jgi:hypothetical protein